MSHPAAAPSPTASIRAIPPAAWALVVASATMVALLAHHPVIGHATTYADKMAALARLGTSAALVHGVLFGVVAMLLYGVTALALALDARRPAVAFGLICHALGCGAVGGAMLLDGFITAPLAQAALDHGWPADATTVTFSLVAISIQMLTKAGLVGMGVGMCCLSWSRARDAAARGTRAAGRAGHRIRGRQRPAHAHAFAGAAHQSASAVVRGRRAHVVAHARHRLKRQPLKVLPSCARRTSSGAGAHASPW